MRNETYTLNISNDGKINDKALDYIYNSLKEQLADYDGKCIIALAMSVKDGRIFNVVSLSFYCDNFPDIYIPEVKQDDLLDIDIQMADITEANRIREMIWKQPQYHDLGERCWVGISPIDESPDGASFRITFSPLVETIPKLKLFKEDELTSEGSD